MRKTLAVYSDLKPSLQVSLNDAADRIRDRLRHTIANIIEIGHDLNAVKTTLGHGRFLPWIEAQFGMSEQTARNFMNVATRFPKSQSLLDLKITKEALYMLSAPSTDVEVVDVAVEKAQAGEKVGKAEVDQIKQELKTEQEKSRGLDANITALISERERLQNADLAQRGRILELEHELESTKKPDRFELLACLERESHIGVMKLYWLASSQEDRTAFCEWLLEDDAEDHGS